MLQDDTAGGGVQEVNFVREPSRNKGSIEAAGELLGCQGSNCDRIRCLHLPLLDKLGYALHIYIDLEGVRHGLPHNSNATQLFLISNLPDEPPAVSPDSIQGPAILTVEMVNTQQYVDLSTADWDKLKTLCRKFQPSAMFVG